MVFNDMEFFHEASKRICGSLHAETMLRDTLEYLRQFMPAEGLYFNIYEPGKRRIRNIAEVSSYPEGWVTKSAELTAEGARYIELEDHEKVHIVNQLDDNPISKVALSETAYLSLSLMVMILELSGEFLGVAVVSSRGRDLYKPEHSRLFELLHDPFAVAMANTLQHQEVLRLKDMLADDYRYLAGELRQMSGEEIVGAEYGLKSVMDSVRQVAPLTSHVLLSGETGVGKEVIANAIHYSSPRHAGPFIKVNCGALPESLVDSELFGHEKGAFTGAVSSRRGRFERAHNGTIFLDEIGDLPLTAQNRLLRVIQEKQIERVGGGKPINVDIRIIAATHRDLQQMVREHSFREDLWFRLNVFPINIPPLRRRKADIPALVQHFVRKKCHEMKIRSRPEIAPGQMEKLINYDWPGNVRELENQVEKALIRSFSGASGGGLFFEDVRQAESFIQTHESISEKGVMSLDEVMINYITTVLSICGGKIEGPDGAAALLKVNPSTLRNKMRKLGVSFGRKRSNV